MLIITPIRKLIYSFASFIFITPLFSGSSRKSVLKGKRLYNYGNPRALRYKENSVEKKTQEKNEEIRKTCIDLYKVITSTPNLTACLRDMVLIKGVDSFNIGPSTKNPLEKISVKIDNFLLKSKKVTRDEYYNFVETVCILLNKKKTKKIFYMSEKEIKSRFLSRKKKNNNKKTDQKSIQMEEKEEEYKAQLEDYLSLRRDMIANLNDKYISFLLPRYEDYKGMNSEDNEFINKYSTDAEYGNYPIILVDYYQYVEYCKWQTFIANEFLFQNLNKGTKILLIFYPVSYAEYQYAACCGDPKNLFGCGSFNIIDETNNFKFNCNDRKKTNKSINISRVDKYPRNAFGIYDCNGNTRIWFGSNENDYTDKNRKDNMNWENKGFSKLLEEGVYTKSTDPKNIDKQKLFKMTSKGDCNSRLEDIQNGRYETSHVLNISPFKGFTIAARLLYFN